MSSTEGLTTTDVVLFTSSNGASIVVLAGDLADAAVMCSSIVNSTVTDSLADGGVPSPVTGGALADAAVMCSSTVNSTVTDSLADSGDPSPVTGGALMTGFFFFEG